MFNLKDTNRYVFAILLIVVASFVGEQFKKRYLNDPYSEEDEIIKQYLLNESPLYGFNKPKLWIHTKYELNSRKWLDFSSRNSWNLNMSYIHLTIKTIVDQNSEDFHICLIDDCSFSKLIPKWNVDVLNLPEPKKSYFRELGMMKLLTLYGGMVVPDSFICQKPLKSFYDENISNGNPFICENINRTTRTNKMNKKMEFIPDTFFMGSPKKSLTMEEFDLFLTSQLSLPDFTEERIFVGNTAQWCMDCILTKKMNIVSAQRIGVKTKDGKPILMENLFQEKPLELSKNCVGVYIPKDEILKRTKYNWFAYLNKTDVLHTKAIMVDYISDSMIHELEKTKKSYTSGILSR